MVVLYGFFRIIFVHAYPSFNGDENIYAGFLNERCIHLWKCEILGSYNRPRIDRVCRFCLIFYVFLYGIFS
jgi:hypothetical protein